MGVDSLSSLVVYVCCLAVAKRLSYHPGMGHIQEFGSCQVHDELSSARCVLTRMGNQKHEIIDGMIMFKHVIQLADPDLQNGGCSIWL